MVFDFSFVIVVVFDVVFYVVFVIVVVVVVSVVVEVCKWVYSEVMYMFGCEGYSDDNGGWV